MAKAKTKSIRRPVASAARQAPLPRSIAPELPTLVDAAPEGDDWLHEMKFDGYRMVAFKNGQQVRFETRNALDWTHKVPALAEAIGRLRPAQLILDGEVVAFDDRGVSDFQLLQNAFRDPAGGRMAYLVFDLLYRDGVDLRALPLDERKRELARLKLPTDRGFVRMSEAVIGHGPQVFEAAGRAGLEGIVSKRRESPYRSGRGTDWIKVKCQNHSEFVIGGFTDPGGSRQGFGALLLGYFDRQKRLVYAGRVGTGFSHTVIAQLIRRLESLERRTTPFAQLPLGAGRPGVHWVRPELVAQIRFSNWTRDNLLRQPAFLGLREDKPARDVHRDTPRHVGLASPETRPASGSRRAGQTAQR